MKLLQNPWVVGILAMAALFVVFRNTITPLWQRIGQVKDNVTALSAEVKAAAASEKKTAPAPPLKPEIKPLAGMDLPAIQTNYAHWVDSPRRDPFIGQFAPLTRAGSYPPAMQLLTLRGIWRQTGGKLAAINNQILSEGDDVLAFHIETIESDLVWVQGPNGREQVTFPLPGQTNANRPLLITGPIDSKTISSRK